MCCCCGSDRICVRALIVLAELFGLYVTLVLVTCLRVLSVETCARAFSLVRLNPMSHIVSPVCLDQLSPINLCDRFCGSGIDGVTSQAFNIVQRYKYKNKNSGHQTVSGILRGVIAS